jgi:hypothetical protein
LIEIASGVGTPMINEDATKKELQVRTLIYPREFCVEREGFTFYVGNYYLWFLIYEKFYFLDSLRI